MEIIIIMEKGKKPCIRKERMNEQKQNTSSLCESDSMAAAADSSNNRAMGVSSVYVVLEC